MYDPEIARFSTPDPALNEKSPAELLELQDGKLYSQSPYSYSYNNPVRYVDPDGKTPWDVLDIGFALWSVKDFVKNPSWSNLGWATVDVVGAALPLVPTSGYFRRGAQVAEAGMDVARGADNVADAAKVGTEIFGGLTDGQKLSTSDALNKAEGFLGADYKETSKGIFVSNDGTRRVRMTDSDLSGHSSGVGKNPHINFETGQTIVDSKGREIFRVIENKHILYD